MCCDIVHIFYLHANCLSNCTRFSRFLQKYVTSQKVHPMSTQPKSNILKPKLTEFLFVPDHQKLEREARICRLLKHPNIGKLKVAYTVPFHTGHDIKWALKSQTNLNSQSSFKAQARCEWADRTTWDIYVESTSYWFNFYRVELLTSWWTLKWMDVMTLSLFYLKCSSAPWQHIRRGLSLPHIWPVSASL